MMRRASLVEQQGRQGAGRGVQPVPRVALRCIGRRLRSALEETVREPLPGRHLDVLDDLDWDERFREWPPFRERVVS